MGFLWFMLVFFLLILVGMPITIAMIILSFFYLEIKGVPVETMAANMFTGMTNFVLLAIPLFILTAEVMDRTRVTDRMFRFANALVGYMPGGLAHVNIITSVIFAGMSGAAVADVGGIGHVCQSEMVKKGYSPYYSAGITMSSSLIGPIIPPSIPVIIYSMATGASVGKLLFAGVVPGLLMAAALMVYGFVCAKLYHHPREPMVPWRVYIWELARSFLASLPALVTPVILLLCIYTGITTTTEAAALAVCYALFLGLVLFRTLSFAEFVDSFKSVFQKCGPVLLAIPAGKAFGYVLTTENVQARLYDLMFAVSGGNRWVILVMIMALFLVLGMLSDPNVNIMLFAPMVASIAVSVGFDEIHFGILLILNAMLGNITPPVGNVLMAVAALEGLDFAKTCRALAPPLAVLVGVLVLLVVWPPLCTWLPGMIM